MGGSISQLPLINSNASTVGSDRPTRKGKKRSSEDDRTPGDERGDTPQGPCVTKSEQSLAPSEHALFSDWNRRSSSAGDPTPRSITARQKLGLTGLSERASGLPSTTSDPHPAYNRSASSRRISRTDSSLSKSGPDDGLIYQIRAELVHELATAGGSSAVDNKELGLGLDNQLVKDMIHELRITQQPLTQAAPRLLRILREKGQKSTLPGMLQIRDPKHHDSAIIAIHALTILISAETAGQARVASQIRFEMETAFREGARGVDLVVDFSGLAQSELRTNGAALIRRIIADVANRRGFCKKVFFIDFPEDYRLHCARWRNELPRDFRRTIWCVAPENLEHVLPDYASHGREWQNCQPGPPKTVPSSVVPSNRCDPKLAMSRSKSSINILKGIVETSDCNLVFKQFSSSGTSEAEFTIRNVNRSSFVVCRFLPKRAIYTIMPSRTFLLPYPRRQVVTILTSNEFPIRGDVIRLQVYVLNPEDGHQIPPDTDADRMRVFMGELKHEIVLRRGRDLVVSNIIRVPDGDQSDGDMSACDLFEQTAAATGEWDDGNESSYDWTNESIEGQGDPHCAPVGIQKPVTESTQTRRVRAATADIQTDPIQVAERSDSYSSSVQTDQETIPILKITQSDTVQTDLRPTFSGVVQTGEIDRSTDNTQTDQVFDEPHPLKVTRSAGVETDPKPLTFSFMQTDHHEPVKEQLPHTFSFVQTDHYEPPRPPPKEVKASHQTNPIEPLPHTFNFVQTDHYEPPIPPLKEVKSASYQTQPEEKKPTTFSFMQTDLREVKSAGHQTQLTEPKSVAFGSVQTDEEIRPRAVRSDPGPILMKAVISGFAQTDEEIRPTPRAVRSASGQTQPMELKAVHSGSVQTDQLAPVEVALRPTLSGYMQTDAAPLREVRSASGQTLAETAKAVQEGTVQTDRLENVSQFCQTDPPPMKAVHSGVMQTDEIAEPAVKAVHSAFGQTTAVATSADFMQTESLPHVVEKPPKIVRSAFGQTDAEVKSAEVTPTQTKSMPTLTFGQTQTDIRKAISDISQTDRMEPPPTVNFRSYSWGFNQTEPPANKFVITQTDFKEKAPEHCPVLPVPDIRPGITQTEPPAQKLVITQTDFKEKIPEHCPVPPVPEIRSGIMQTEPAVKPQIDHRLTQTDPAKVEIVPVSEPAKPKSEPDPPKPVITGPALPPVAASRSTPVEPTRPPSMGPNPLISVEEDQSVHRPLLARASQSLPPMGPSQIGEDRDLLSHFYSAPPGEEHTTEIDETLSHFYTAAPNDGAPAEPIPEEPTGQDINPLWIVAAVLALAWFAHWLELHKVVAESTWVADWKFKDGVSVGGLGNLVKDSSNVVQPPGGGSVGSSWTGGTIREQKESSAVTSSSWGGAPSPSAAGRASPAVTNYDRQQAGGNSGSSYSTGEISRAREPQVVAENQRERDKSRTWQSERPNLDSQRSSGSSWFAATGETDTERPAIPVGGKTFSSGATSQSLDGQTRTVRQETNSPPVQWSAGNLGGQSESRRDRSTTDSSRIKGESGTISNEFEDSTAQKSSSWFSGKSDVQFTSRIRDDHRVHFVRDGSLLPDGTSSYRTPSPAGRTYSPSSSASYPKSASEPRAVSSASRRTEQKVHRPPPGDLAATTVKPQPKVGDTLLAEQVELMPGFEPRSVPGFETSYSGFWPTDKAADDAFVDEAKSYGDMYQYSPTPSSFRGISGPAYSQPAADQPDEVPRSFVTNFMFGTPPPRKQPEHPPEPKPREHQLMEFKPDLTSTLPILRGLEWTTPEIGMTKQWLHSWPFRFDPTRLECWDRLRTNPNYFNACKPPVVEAPKPLLKKKCVDQFFTIEHYVSCRVAHAYDHSRWGV